MTAPAASRLVVRPPNWLGDAVLAVPALAAIRRRFTDAELTIAAPPAIAALFREDTPVRPDRVLELADSTRERAAALDAGRFDLGILFPNSFRSAWQFRRGRIPERWGYATAARGILLTRASRPARRAGARHQSDYYRDLVTGLGIPCAPDEPPQVAPRAASAEGAARLLQAQHVPPDARLVGFAPGAAYGQAKQWPPHRVAAVMARAVREHDITPVVVGAAHDREAARAIESWLRAHAPDVAPRVVNLAGRTNLGVLVGLVARMTAFVSNDSGAMHLAAAAGRPVIAIFGPTNERATHPIGDHDVLTHRVFCRPCMLRDCPIDHRCMKGITADAVFQAVSADLAAKVAGGSEG
jgi:heptosyltransferase-2